jgi:Holliday junction resolvase
MTMTNQRKELGSGLERRVVARAQAKGLRASRQPLSGILKEYPNDVVVENYLGECKVRSEHPSWNEIQKWLEGCQAHAKKHGFAGAFLVYNPKGSQTPYVITTLAEYLDLQRKAKLDNEKRMVV